MLVNPRTGIVRRLTRYRPEAGDAPLVIVGADVAPPTQLGGAKELSASGAAGFTWDEASRAAVGEAVERYCASFLRRDVWGSAREVAGESDWALFSEDQYAHPEMHFARWDDDAPMWWTRATRLSDGKATFVPSQFAHLPYFPDEGEPILAPGFSTGLAAAPTLESAALHALYEIVERDAFTLAWLHRATPPRVRDLPPRAAALARHADVRLLDITHDVGLPSYLCALEQRTTVGVVRVVGAATRHDPIAAMEKAVVEAYQTVPYVRELVRAEPRWRAGPKFENLRDFRDHARLYTVHPERREGLAHLLDGPFVDAPERARVPGGLADVVSRLARLGLESHLVDLTTDDVRDAGLRVVRGLVPGAQPLHGFYQVPHLAGPRFLAGARVLPYLAPEHARTPETVNPWPHPFA